MSQPVRPSREEDPSRIPPEAERRILDLEERVRRLEAGRKKTVRPRPGSGKGKDKGKGKDPSRLLWPGVRRGLGKLRGRGARWVPLVGALFLFLSAGFFVKYVFDQGWITPWLQVGLGALLGAALLATGRWMESRRRWVGYACSGLAVAILYLSGYAAREVHALIPYGAAFAALASVSALAFYLALRYDRSVFSVLAYAGGVSAPLLLESARPSPAGLYGYLIPLLLAGGAILLRRRWTLLWLAILIGSVFPLIAGTPPALSPQAEGAGALALALGTAAAILYWSASSALPLILQGRRGAPGPDWSQRRLLLGGVIAAWAAATTGFLLWELSEKGFGAVIFGAALLHGLLAVSPRLAPSARAAASQIAACAPVPAALLAWSAGTAFAALCAYLFGLIWLARGVAGRFMGRAAHVAALVVAVVFGVFAHQGLGASDAPGPESWTALAGIFLVLVGTRLWMRPGGTRALYAVASAAALVVWCPAALAPLPYGAALASGAWAAIGGAMILFRARLTFSGALPGRLGLALLAAVSIKMLFFDLRDLGSLQRILLFFATGLVFLALGYWLERTGKRARPPN